MPKDDLLNIINELKKLNDEIAILKEENKYLRRKAEIAPLVAIYNHVPGHEIIITKKDGKPLQIGRGNETIIVKNDELQASTKKGLKKLCAIEDIVMVQLDNIEYDLENNNAIN